MKRKHKETEAAREERSLTVLVRGVRRYEQRMLRRMLKNVMRKRDYFCLRAAAVKTHNLLRQLQRHLTVMHKLRASRD